MTFWFQNEILGSGAYHTYDPEDAAPNVDGLEFDDRLYTARYGGDITRTGSQPAGVNSCHTYNWNNPSAAEIVADNWRAGLKKGYEMQDTLYTNAGLPQTPFRSGNLDFINYIYNRTTGIPPSSDARSFGSMNGVCDSCVIEAYLGAGNLEGSIVFSKATMQDYLDKYQQMEDALRGPKITAIDVAYLQSDGRFPANNGWSGDAPLTYLPGFSSTPGTNGGSGFRYVLAFVLMKSGAISWSATHSGSGSDNDLTTFDEMGNNGCANCPPGYLGYPDVTTLGQVQKVARYANGIWERRFYNPNTPKFGGGNGAYWRVALNPRYNATQTYRPTDINGNGITLWKIHGNQNPGYNNGASFTSLTMTDPDGCIACESQLP
jgi:hypothetical protein